jgi:hypothetical protein
VIVLDERVAEAPVASQWLGETLALRAYSGVLDTTGTAVSVVVDAGPALPLRPANPRAARNAGGDVALSWTRRSRADADSWGIADAPLEVVPEAYRVKVFNGVAVVRTIDVATPATTYTAAQQTADFGSLPSSFTFTVAQLSASLGPGHLSTGAFHA